MVFVIPGHIKVYVRCLWRQRPHARPICALSTCIALHLRFLCNALHDPRSWDFTRWFDLESLPVDIKPELLCLLEHIVLHLKRLAQCAAWKGCGEQRAGERFLRAGRSNVTVLCNAHFVTGSSTICLYNLKNTMQVCHTLIYSWCLL